MSTDGVQTGFELILEELGSVMHDLQREAENLVKQGNFGNCPRFPPRNILHPYPCAHLDCLQGRVLLQDREFLLLQTGGANGRYAVSLHEDDWRLVV